MPEVMSNLTWWGDFDVLLSVDPAVTPNNVTFDMVAFRQLMEALRDHPEASLHAVEIGNEPNW